MSAILLTVLGTCIVAGVAYDVYATVLHARARSGPIGETLNRTVWRMSRTLAFRIPRQRRHKLLNTVGPLLLPLLIIIYIVLLVSAFALVYYAYMPAHFVVAPEAMSPPWIESVYFSGITLTTVGYGDIAPHTTLMRLVALVESASGFALISLTVTYLITVYGALERKRAVALSFYHQAEEGADVAGFIAHHFVEGRFYGLDATLRLATRDIQGLLESHVEHPVIHYFHPVEVYKSLPRMLFLMLETCSVIRSCLDAEQYRELYNHPVVRNLEASARHVLYELDASLGLERRRARRTETTYEESRRWGGRYQATMRRLSDAGIETRSDRRQGLEEYRAQREEWESKLHRFALYLGYDWDETTGDRDLRYAADEEMEEPMKG
ncbi:MAG TPA: potassium channel family protein [Pyrinomonadaceae bacterium]